MSAAASKTDTLTLEQLWALLHELEEPAAPLPEVSAYGSGYARDPQGKTPLCGVDADGLRYLAKQNPDKMAILRFTTDDERFGSNIGLRFIDHEGKTSNVPNRHLKDRDLRIAYGNRSEFLRKTETKLRLKRKLAARKA